MPGKIIEFKNGALYDRDKGQIISAPTKSLFTSETGRAAVLKRWEDKRAAFAAGFADGVPENYAALKGDADAWRAVGKRLAEAIFAESKNQRGLAELVRVTGEFSGWTPSQADLKQTSEPPGRTEAELKAVTELVQAIKAAIERDSIDAHFE